MPEAVDSTAVDPGVVGCTVVIAAGGVAESVAESGAADDPNQAEQGTTASAAIVARASARWCMSTPVEWDVVGLLTGAFGGCGPLTSASLSARARIESESFV
jgi:hypothetical protein